MQKNKTMKLSLRLKNAVIFVFFLSFFNFGQIAKTAINQTHSDHEKCGTSERNRTLLQNDPNYALRRQEAEAHYQQYLNAPFVDKALNTIPIVVHVIHRGEAVGSGTNISDAQIISAIENMTDAYRNMAPYTGVDTEIEFCLAQRDPNGNPHSGINRVSGNTVTNYSTQGIISSNEQDVKALSKWDNTRYYNFWIVAEIDNNGGDAGTQGYAYYPGAGSAVDGAVMLYNAFGYDPNGNLGYNLKSYTNKNVTAIHEMGHALNLYHTFEGDGTGTTCPGAGNLCGSDIGDCVADTPPHKRSNSDCQTNTVDATCNNVDRDLYVHNFMDYSSDVCQTQFTAGQGTRMQAALSNFTASGRGSLTNSDGCNPVFANDVSITNIVAPNGSYCLTTFSPQVTLKNVGTSNLTSAVITYNIDGGANQTFNWTGTLASGASEIVTLNSVTTSAGAHTFNATSTLPNGLADQFAANNTSSANFTINSSASLPFNEDFEGIFPPNNWTNISADEYTGDPWDTDPSVRQWEKRAVTQQSSGVAGNAAAFNGFSYGYNTGGLDELVTPSIDFTNASSPQLKFQVSYKYYGASNFEKLRVLVSTDCGVTYSPVYDKQYTELALATAGQSTTSWAPTLASHWREETIDLSAYAGEITTFKFEATNGYGNNLYIDKINITDNCSAPVITSHPSSVSTCSFSNVSFTVANSNGGTYRWQRDDGNGFTDLSDVGVYSNTSQATMNMTGVTGGFSNFQYRCVVTNACGTVTSNPATLIVNGIPATPTITASGATTFCQGGSVTLTSSNILGNTWSTGETTREITVSSSGTYTVFTTAGVCQSATSAGTTVNVTSLPIITLGNTSNPTTCSGTNGFVQINGTGTGTLSWTGTTNGSLANFPLGTFVSNLGAGNYNFTFNNGCTSNTLSVSLSDPNGPATPTITAGGATTICSGQSVTLTASATTGTYLWSNGQTTQSISASNAGSYSVTINVGGCTASSTATTVIVNPIPSSLQINGDGPLTFCQGDQVTLTATPGNGYLWSTGATTQSITVSTAGNYTVQQVMNGCVSSASATSQVIVNPIPSISLGLTTNPSACLVSDGSIVVSGTGTGNLNVNGNITPNFNLGSAITGLAAGNYNISFDNGCISNTLSATLSDPGVVTPTISSDLGNSVCIGQVVTLTSSSATGNTWSTGETTQSIQVSNAGSYSVTAVNAGCSASSTNFVLTVNPLPAIPTISAGGATTFCEGGSVTLMSSSVFGNLWSTGETSQSITVTSGASYSLTVTENGCSSSSSATVVTVNPAPTTPIITSAGSLTICAGETVTLTSSAVNNITWSTNETTQSITTGAAGTYTVSVTENGCSSTSAPTTVVVNQLVVPTATAQGVLTFCEGGSVVLSSSEANGNNWSNGETTQNITVNTAGTYSVTVGSGACAGTSGELVVTVNPLPTVTLAAFSDICNTVATFDLSGGLPANGTYSVNGNSTTQFVPSTASIGPNTVVYSFTDGNQCSASASQTINVNDCSNISEKEMNFKVYPNPTNSILQVESNSLINSIILTDELGRKVFESQLNNGSTIINLEKFASGVYSVRIVSNNFNEVHKINLVK